MNLWPTQIKAIEGAKNSLRSGKRFPCVVSHTGSGKSKVMREMVRGALDKGKRVALFVHRRILRDQVIKQFEEEKIPFGVIASGHKEKDAPVQICMNQTAWARVNVPDADLVLWDEAHVQGNGNCKIMQDTYKKDGACQIGFTATPVNLNCDDLVIASTFQDCLNQGSHLPAKCYGPDRPEWWKYKTSGGEYSPKDNNRLMQNIYGRVVDYWKKYNPDARPAVLFASSSEASRWWCHKFRLEGVKWASIDCDRLYWNTYENGRLITKVYENTDSQNSRDIKNEIFQRFKDGDIRGISNRFILREAWDAPFVYHCIIATMMGSVATYLQSVGRVMRAYPEYDFKVIQDHGGVIDRHGRPDIEREWELGDSVDDAFKRERDKVRKKENETNELHEICCPCGFYRSHGATCPECGRTNSKPAKMVVEESGKLVEIPHTPYQVKKKTSNEILVSQYYRAKNSGRNLRAGQVVAMARTEAAKQGVDWKYSDVKIHIPAKNTLVKDWRL